MESSDAILVYDHDGKILAWNQGAMRMYGYTEAEALTMDIRDLVPAGQVTDALEIVRKLIKGEILEPFESSRQAKDGHDIDVWICATALRNQDGRPYAIATTERELAARRLAWDEHDVLARFERLTQPRTRSHGAHGRGLCKCPESSNSYKARYQPKDC